MTSNGRCTHPLITDNFCITSFVIISCEAREWKRKKNLAKCRCYCRNKTCWTIITVFVDLNSHVSLTARKLYMTSVTFLENERGILNFFRFLCEILSFIILLRLDILFEKYARHTFSYYATFFCKLVKLILVMRYS